MPDASKVTAAATLQSVRRIRTGALIGLVLTATFLFVAIFAQWIAPYGSVKSSAASGRRVGQIVARNRQPRPPSPVAQDLWHQTTIGVVVHHETLQQVAEALLKARPLLLCEFKTIEKRLVSLAA
ncbi:hypothetical protein [Mesorhizobium sp.]|uniref:hypothetical protein n=1 Tax=Mesorhizobium sp. TaxID=1871066 RepID=UPI00257A77A5|nr:hypothetical protein [Mesorhizobium sp.]